jgi:hypothetical protein
MNATTTTIVSLAALTMTAAGQTALEGPYASNRWADTGIEEGTTSIGEAVEFFYDVVDSNPSDGVAFRTAEYSTTASEAGLVRIFYDARYRHRSFSREFFLQAFVDSESGRELITLVDEFDPAASDISPNFEGVVELDTKAGFDYGFIIGGGHFTGNPNLNGNVVIWDLGGGTGDLQTDASQWTAGPMLEGVTGVRDALRLDYSVVSTFGVTPRTTDLTAFATEDGSAAFNWSFRGNHRFFAASASLSVIADGEGGEDVIPVVDNVETNGTFFFRGRTAIDVESSNEFGIRVGGGNFDAGNRLDGTVILSRFGVTEAPAPEVCLADLNNDGIRDLSDIGLFVDAFTATDCP